MITFFFLFFFFKYLFIYLAALVLVLAGSSSLTRDRTWFPLHWECGVLATGPPGKFHIILPSILYFNNCSFFSGRTLWLVFPTRD